MSDQPTRKNTQRTNPRKREPPRRRETTETYVWDPIKQQWRHASLIQRDK